MIYLVLFLVFGDYKHWYLFQVCHMLWTEEMDRHSSQQEWHHCMWPQIRVFVLKLYVQCSMVRRLNQFVGPMAPSQTNILPKSWTEDVPWPKTSSCRPVRADSHRCERQTTHFSTNAAHKREQKTMLTGGESRNIKVRIRGGGGFFTMKTLCSLQRLCCLSRVCVVAGVALDQIWEGYL